MTYVRACAAGLIIAMTIAPARAMVGGAPPAADGAGRSVVMVLGEGGTVCTATAIARDLLLSAAHCVHGGGEYKLVASGPGEPPVLKDIVRAVADPQFDLKRLFGHVATPDVSLFKLAEPLPPKIPAAPLVIGDEPIAVGDSFIVAGYGLTVRGDGRTGGTVRAATLVATGHPSSLELRLYDPKTKGDTPGLGACTGDSGAPAFRNKDGRMVVVGVVSWSTGPKLQGGCGGLTGVTPLARYRTWIVDMARMLGSPLAP